MNKIKIPFSNEGAFYFKKERAQVANPNSAVNPSCSPFRLRP
ncbi:hypothetical protein [Leeuwenhoekiella sp. H156]